jgi:hypothetical protein
MPTVHSRKRIFSTTITYRQTTEMHYFSRWFHCIGIGLEKHSYLSGNFFGSRLVGWNFEHFNYINTVFYFMNYLHKHSATCGQNNFKVKQN